MSSFGVNDVDKKPFNGIQIVDILSLYHICVVLQSNSVLSPALDRLDALSKVRNTIDDDGEDRERDASYFDTGHWRDCDPVTRLWNLERKLI